VKRITAIILSVLTVLLSFSFCQTAFALKTTDVARTQIGTSDTYYEFNAETKTLTISGSGAIPNMLNDDTSQPWSSWRSDGSIDNVVIEEGITAVGNYVLYQVSAESVQLPSTLKKIGNYAFAYNSKVKSYDVPFGVEMIGVSAFENCISMTEVTLPDTVSTISKNAFKQCYKLESVRIPYSVTSMGNYAFHRCSELSCVEFESLSTAVKIGSYAFMACPKLEEVSVPLNATLNSYTFGYDDSKKKYDGFAMNVYSGSDALSYAMAKGFEYNMLDKFPLNLGIMNYNEFIEETINYEYIYSFIPSASMKYNIYSVGDVDLTAVLYENEAELITSDDISKDNLNFCLSYELEAGREYTVSVKSVRSEGEYGVVVYPDVINSFDIKGSLSFNAADGVLNDGGIRVFEITDEMLEGFILTIDFEGGYKDKIYYENKFFDNRQIEIADTQSKNPLTCGNNSCFVSIGEVLSAFDVFIEHSYEEEVIPYTVDDDGYSVFTCVLCKDTYKGNFVPTPAVTVSGKAVLMEKPDGSHEHNIPYPYATFFANDRTYYIDAEGNFSVNTFDDLDLVFENENGRDVSVHIDVDSEDVDFGFIAFEGYDFNKDNYVNAKDFAIFLKEKQNKYGEDYWKYAINFV